MVHGQEIALRAIGTALAGLSGAFAVYMLAYGEGKRASTAWSTWRSSPSRAGRTPFETPRRRTRRPQRPSI